MGSNPEHTLVENRNRDTWQLPVQGAAGEYLGNVIAQIVQPRACMVRYFLVYDAQEERHFLIPSDTVTAIEDKVYCSIADDQVTKFPSYERPIRREDESYIYAVLSQQPYWERES